MVISETINKKRQKEVTAEGYVKVVKVEKFPETKVFVWDGKKIESTHKASVLLEKDGDSVWVSLGEFKSQRDNVTFKVDDQWKELKVGQLVIIDIKKVNEKDGKKYYTSSKSSITILEEAPEGSQSIPAASGSQGNAKPQGKAGNGSKGAPAASGVTKIYGAILSIDGDIATVHNEDNKDYQVNVQGYTVAVGGRLGAKIDAAGIIQSGFKFYPKVDEIAKISQVAEDGFNSVQRQFKISFGNMVNVASYALGHKDTNKVMQLAQNLFEPAALLRVQLIEMFKETRSDGDISGKLGDALKHAAVGSKGDIEAILAKAEEIVIAHIKAEEATKAAQEGKQKGEQNVPAKPEQKPAKPVNNPVVPAPPVYSEPPMDFDDCIPF